MKETFRTALLLTSSLVMVSACDSKKDPVVSGRAAVKGVVTQPFKALESAKDSLKQSEDKSNQPSKNLKGNRGSKPL